MDHILDSPFESVRRCWLAVFTNALGEWTMPYACKPERSGLYQEAAEEAIAWLRSPRAAELAEALGIAPTLEAWLRAEPGAIAHLLHPRARANRSTTEVEVCSSSTS